MFEWGHYCDVGLSLQLCTSQQAGGWAHSNHRWLPGSCSWTCMSQIPDPSWQSVFDGDQWVGTELFLSGGVSGIAGLRFSSKITRESLSSARCAFHSPTAARLCQSPFARSALFPQMGCERQAATGASPRGPVCHGGGGAGQSSALCRCVSVSCQSTSSPGSAIGSGDPPAAFGNIIPWIANFCVWCENIENLLFEIQFISCQ